MNRLINKLMCQSNVQASLRANQFKSTTCLFCFCDFQHQCCVSIMRVDALLDHSVLHRIEGRRCASTRQFAKWLGQNQTNSFLCLRRVTFTMRCASSRDLIQRCVRSTRYWTNRTQTDHAKLSRVKLRIDTQRGHKKYKADKERFHTLEFTHNNRQRSASMRYGVKLHVNATLDQMTC